MKGIIKEETIVEISKMLKIFKSSKDEDGLAFANKLYESFIQPIREKLILNENRYNEDYSKLNNYINEMMNLLSKHINSGLKEKSERILYLENFIKENILRSKNEV